jgi:lysophospholipase L1-like esterase
MRGLVIVIALSPFLLLELGLRHFAPPAAGEIVPDPLIQLQQTRPLFVLDRDAGLWHISPQRRGLFRPASFSENKPTGTRRIFVLGGSTVQGRPYSTETSLTTWLRLALDAAGPDRHFEVVNCGGVSYASYRVAKILDEVLDHQPDAIVIYTGHNEFLEDREYAEVRQMSAPRRWISHLAAKLRTVTWIQSKLSRPIVAENLMPSEVDARLDHHGGLAKYQRDPSWRSGVERHFAETLGAMVTRTKRAGVPLVLCVPASDLVNTPPFKVQSLAALDDQQAAELRDAWAIIQDGNAPAEHRLAACEAYLAIDRRQAGANYIAGRLHYGRGDTAPAIEYLTAARDFDVCPLRATTPITSAVIQIARQDQIPLVETIQLLDQRDAHGHRVPDGIADPEFFVDHVHPTVAGHQRIGVEIATKIEALGWFQTSPGADHRYQQSVEQHLSQLGEEYYARGRQRLEGLRRWAAGRAGKLGQTSGNE